LDVFGLLIDVVAHKRSVGSKSAPSAARSAPRHIHTFLSARWYRCSLWVTATISTLSGSSAQRRELRYNWAQPICFMSHSGDERVREGSTMPAKHTGIGLWITGNSTVVLRGVDCGDPSGVMMSSAL
jgi:hypothetical protein